MSPAFGAQLPLWWLMIRQGDQHCFHSNYMSLEIVIWLHELSSVHVQGCHNENWASIKKKQTLRKNQLSPRNFWYETIVNLYNVQIPYNVLYNAIHYTVLYNILYNSIHYTVLYTIQYYTIYFIILINNSRRKDKGNQWHDGGCISDTKFRWFT